MSINKEIIGQNIDLVTQTVLKQERFSVFEKIILEGQKNLQEVLGGLDNTLSIFELETICLYLDELVNNINNINVQSKYSLIRYIQSRRQKIWQLALKGEDKDIKKNRKYNFSEIIPEIRHLPNLESFYKFFEQIVFIEIDNAENLNIDEKNTIKLIDMPNIIQELKNNIKNSHGDLSQDYICEQISSLNLSFLDNIKTENSNLSNNIKERLIYVVIEDLP